MDNDSSVAPSQTEPAAQPPAQSTGPSSSSPPPDLPGLNILNRLLATLRAAEDNEARRGAWVSVQDPDIMTALAHAWNREETTMTTLFSTIASINACAARTRNLRSAVRGLADSMARNSRSPGSTLAEDRARIISLAASFGNGAPPATVVSADVLEQLCVPPGFAVDATGVYRVSVTQDGDVNRTRVAASPLFMAGRTVDVLTGEARRQLVWRGPAGWCSRIVPRRTLLDTSRIISLADLEAPVNSTNLVGVVTYLAEFEAENGHRLPAVDSTPRMGWQPGGGFLLPEKYFATDDEASTPLRLTPPTGFESMAKGWLPQGTWDAWVEAMDLVVDYPHMYIAMYASVAAPLLSILGLSGFVVDFSGETSGGKTTALRFAASVWGRPSESYPTAMFSWDATTVWIERTAGYLQNLPLILDETKRAKNNRMVRDTLYNFCQGQGRGRGSVDGTRHTASWCSVLLSSGEGAATSFSEDAGTRARVITLQGKPLGSNPEVGGRISETSQAILEANHGHLGRKVAEYLVRTRSRRDEIRAVFEEAREKYTMAARTAVGRRHAAYIAALEVAAGISHQLGVPQPKCDPFGYLMECQEAASLDADRPLAALQDLLSWCTANQHRFFGRQQVDSRGSNRPPVQGWAGKWHKRDDWEMISITVLELRSVMDELGHDHNEITQRWAERGWLVKGQTQRHRTRPIRIEGGTFRCYSILRAASDQALDDSEYNV